MTSGNPRSVRVAASQAHPTGGGTDAGKPRLRPSGLHHVAPAGCPRQALYFSFSRTWSTTFFKTTSAWVRARPLDPDPLPRCL